MSECKDSSGLYDNYEGLNMLSAVFSVIFTIFNSLLLSFLIKNKKYVKAILGVVYLMMFSILIFTNFDFTHVVYLSVATILLSLIFACLLVPFFQIVSDSIITEAFEEQKWAFKKENQYKKMFDSLQEGIIVMQNQKIHFMNDLSTKILKHVSGALNFYGKQNKAGNTNIDNHMDTKLFYEYVNSRQGEEKKSKKKKSKKSKKKKSSSEASSDNGGEANNQFGYSLNDISQMDIQKLKTMMFTFDRKLAISGDLTKVNDDTVKLNLLLRSLKCMRGIDDEFIPTFKFFQFKKSFIIRDSTVEND